MGHRITWKDRACGYETLAERRCRHNGIPYRGGCGGLASDVPAPQALRRAIGEALARKLREDDSGQGD